MTLLIETENQLRKQVAAWRQAGMRIGFVPTMGALHAGHISLVEAANLACDRVVVSIFVNPKQFGAGEDLDKYPRTFDADYALLQEADADALFMPTVDVIYPAGFSTSIHVSGVSEGLCGAARPGHFDGVATVVARLFLLTMPDIAYFGEKDYQQLQVIRRMVADLGLPLTIQPVPTFREADGLAMSSRNRYLSVKDREIAPELQRALQLAAAAIRGGADVAATLKSATASLLAAGFDKVDYLELRRAETLAPLTQYAPAARLLAAAFLGTTRLIDNIELKD